MKKLLALTALGLLAPAAVLAAEPAVGGPERPIVPPFKLPQPTRFLIGIGQLMPAEYKPRPGFDIRNLPRWQIVLGNDTSEQSLYYLVFDGKKDLEKLADKLKGTWVQIKGHVERRQFPLNRVPRRPGGPVFADRPHTTLTVLVVDSLEVAPVRPDARPLQQARVTVTAEVKYVGNAYTLMPDGTLQSTAVGYPWEGCYIVLNGRRVRLEGLPGDIVHHQSYHGQTLVLSGRLEHRRVPPGWPSDVLVVESFRGV
jgi:hypothetical protein